jgi:hypothetical protein
MILIEGSRFTISIAPKYHVPNLTDAEYEY